MALLKDGTRVYGTLFANAGFNSGTINATSNGIVANSTNISLGNSSVNVAITSSTIDLGTQFDANSTGLYHTGTINAASFTTSGLRANTSGIFPTSNTILLGNSIGRFVLSANTGSFSGAVSGITTLATGNTTITGFANASVSVNSALLTVGTSFIANTTGAYHTGLVNAASHTVGSNFIANSTAIVGTGFANVTTSVNSALLTVGTSFIANSTAIVGTGYANVTTSVNSALLTVGTAFIANTTGAYHTGLVNAASHTVGSNFIANSTAIVGTGFANVTTSVNSALLTVGTDFIANTTGAYHTGLVNSASFTTTGFVANTTSIAPTSNTILLGNTIGRFVVSANTIDASGLITGSAGATITGQVNASTGFGVGTINATSNGFFANATSISVGNSTVNVSITPTNIDLGTQFDANSTGLYHTGTVNAATLSVGSSFVANSTTINFSTINATSNGITANTTAIAFGNSSVNISINTSSVNVATYLSGSINATSNGLLANSTTVTVGNSSVNVSITTAGITSSGGTGVNPSSNTVGTALGTNTQRWVLNANTGSFAGLVSGITTLAAGNTTITGFANVTTSIQGGSSLTIAGAASGITTLAAGNTTITGFANVTTSIQGGSSLTIAGAASGITTLAAGNTTITGFANASVSVNSALLTVGTSFVANTTGAYHTGIVNAASHTVGTSFVANTTQVTLTGIPLSANGTTGTSAQVLSSNGTVGSPYWATISSGSTVTATDDTTTAASRYLLFANQTSGTVTAAYVSSTKLTYNPSTGALTSTSHVSSSDERFKTNVVTINSPLDMIKQLRGVSFDRIDSGLKDYGVIAQEIEQVIPDIVHTDDEGYKSVSYSSIIGFLIEGMKHQQVKIDNLENKIEDLLKK